MNKIKNVPYLIRGFIIAIGLTLVLYTLFEFNHFVTKPGNELTQSEILDNLDKASQFFDQYTIDLDQQSESIFRLIDQGVRTNQSLNTIHNRLQQFDLWGITILKNDRVWLWEGYTLNLPRISTDSEPKDIYTTITSYNNVTLLLRSQFVLIDDNLYTILTAKRLSQTIDLPFVRDTEYSLSKHEDLNITAPVVFTFFDPVPDSVLYKTLSIPGRDEVGAVYSSTNNSVNGADDAFSIILLVRILFVTITISLFLLISGYLPLAKKQWVRRGVSVLLVLLFWLITLQFNAHYYLTLLFSSTQSGHDPVTIEGLIRYSIHAVFLFILFINLNNFLFLFRKPIKHDRHFLTILLASIFGIVSVGILSFFTYSTHTVITDSVITLLDLELTPDPTFLFFALFSSLFFVASTGLILTIGYHFYTIEEDKSAIIAVLSLISFICFFFLIGLFQGSLSFSIGSFLLIFSLFFLILIVIHIHHKHPSLITSMSGFRKLMILVLIASSAIYFMIWSSTSSRLDHDILEQVSEFTQEETVLRSDDILFRLLSELEMDLSYFSEDDVENQSPFLLNQFQRSVINRIQDDWKFFSFHIRLLSTENEELTNYSTTIDPPNWSSFFSAQLMLRAHRGEQLRRQTNRPIIWDRPSNISERYTTLNRGWIPIYDPDQANHILAWIAGDIFRERSDFQKPLRAVLTAESDNEWKQSFYLSEYLGDRLVRSALKGSYHDQPQYNRLPERELEIALQDSITFFTNNTVSGSFREVLIQTDGRRIIKASTPYPGFNHHLFSYFRLQIILVFFGLFCFIILGFSGFHFFTLFGQNTRFKNRLIDGLTLATILFLTVLIFGTQYAVSVQNENNVERELLNNLAVSSESLKERSIFSPGVSSDSLLSEISTALNTDLIIYNGSNMAASTTPQIFQHYLLPSKMPFQVFDLLYIKERIHVLTNTKVGDEEMLVGYRSIMDTDGIPIGAIAIPTFLQSPIYKEQLLNTTSYLFVMYLFIFTIFIAGTVFLSNQLTKPLEIIQSGLNKISRGEMETKVSVTSKDEIGSLADAYNQMVMRLDQARKELMKAERESAWKEMAQQIAHEIKNPLTPMKLNLQHLQRQLEANPDNVLDLKPVIEKTAANIIEQIESLNKIASDFSKFAKPVDEPLQPLSLNKVLESVTELYSQDSKVTIHLKKPSGQIIIDGVEDEIRRAFINLIKNAVEAVSGKHPAIQISMKKEKHEVVIEIEDNGSGISEIDKEKVFTPKFSTKSSGTGLGLAITRQIIETHRGDIRFKSEVDKGTTFYIHLPLSDSTL